MSGEIISEKMTERRKIIFFKKRNILVLVFIALTSILQAQDNELDDYLTLAAENNSKLKSLFNQYLASLEKLPQAKALPDPTVMFNVFASPVETRVGAQRAGIAISQVFPWFGQLEAQEESMAMKSKAIYELFKDEKNSIQYQVKAVYYDLYVIEAALSITQQNLKLLESFKQLANVKLESGKGSAVDVLRVEMQTAEMNSQLDYLFDSRVPLRAEFWTLLNVENDLPIVLPQVLVQEKITESKISLLESMMVENPRLKKFDFENSSLNSDVEVAKKRGKPSFTIGLAYTNVAKRTDVNIPGNGKDALVFPQIGLKIPLYRKKYNALIKEKTYLKTANAFEKKNQENVLTIEMERAWRSYKDAIRRIELKTKLTDLAQQSLDILVTEYTSASKDFEEILRMERQVLTYGLELEEARADMSTSAAFIKYLTGN